MKKTTGYISITDHLAAIEALRQEKDREIEGLRNRINNLEIKLENAQSEASYHINN